MTAFAILFPCAHIHACDLGTIKHHVHIFTLIHIVPQYSALGDQLVNEFSPSSSRRVSYKTTRPSPPPQRPRRHLSSVQIATTPLVHRSNEPSLQRSPSVGPSPKGVLTTHKDRPRRSPESQVQLCLTYACEHSRMNRLSRSCPFVICARNSRMCPFLIVAASFPR